MHPSAKTYLRQMVIGLLLYILVLFISIHLNLLLTHHGNPWRIPIATAPVLPALLILRAVSIFFATLDELQRRIQLEALAFAFAASALATFTYGFLQGVGFPQANWTLVWPVMGVLWIIGLVIARRKYR